MRSQTKDKKHVMSGYYTSPVKILLTFFFITMELFIMNSYYLFIMNSYYQVICTVNKEYYLEVSHNLHDAIWRNDPNFGERHLVEFAHWHPLFYLSNSSWQNITPLWCCSQPILQVWPPLTSFYFPKWKGHSKNSVFNNTEMNTKSQAELKVIPKEMFKCFLNWKLHWHKCTMPQRNFSEGDGINIE